MGLLLVISVLPVSMGLALVVQIGLLQFVLRTMHRNV